MPTTERLSERIWKLAATDRDDMALLLRYAVPRLVEFLETHHENEDREHEGCRACTLINHVELELGP